MKNKTVLWVVLGCLVCMIGSGVAILVVWKGYQHAKTVLNEAPPAPVSEPTGATGKGPSWAKNALFMTAYDGDVVKMKELLDKQPERINELVGSMRATMLHMAAYKGRTEAVAELLRRGAKVNLRTKQGHTPLYDCVLAQGTPEIASMLLEHGVDAAIADNDGKTPLQLAIERNRDDMAELLRQHGVQK